MTKTASRMTIASLLIVALGAMTITFAPDFAAKLSYASENGRARAARENLKKSKLNDAVDFRQVAKAIEPSVVNISTVTSSRTMPQLPQPHQFHGPMQDFFSDEFFGRFFGPLPRRSQAEKRSLGTGVIVSDDGYIVTNNHVVKGADEVNVNLTDGRNFKAKIVGTDSKTDIAVLKIDAEDLLPARLGDSERIEVGEWVLAVGNPFGLRNTFTSGIVSAKGRSDMGIARYEDFLQTDAAINPGNSGGPLVDMAGEVIGINTAIASKSGGYQGIGFAIPSAMVRNVMEKLIADGRVVRGWLGLYIQNLDDSLAKSFGFEKEGGILVSEVVEGGPAHKAGLRIGDIIHSLNKKPVPNIKQFSSAVAGLKPGSMATLTVYRDGKEELVEAEIANYPDDNETLRSSSTGDWGIAVRALTPELTQRLGVKSSQGVLVSHVEQGSAASASGLRTGDLIVSVNGENVSSVAEFHAAMSNAGESKPIRLLVETNGHRRFMIIQRKQ